jgi:predicted acyltransferase
MTTTKLPRLISLDVLRGLTIASMITVNNPGSWEYMYAPLQHAEWNGCTPTDLIFPFFLFMVGVAVWFAFKKFDHAVNKETSKKILKRTFLIFIIGVGLNWFPFFRYLSPEETGGFGAMLMKAFANLRIPGVLQRIALAYGAGAFLGLWIKDYKKTLAVIAVLLFGYWAMLAIDGPHNFFGPDNHLVGRIDLAIFGQNHIYTDHIDGKEVHFDPEGLLSTIPSIATVLLGFLLGQFIDKAKSHKKLVIQLLIAGTAMVAAGYLWDLGFPLNKKIWSSSFVIFTAGWATIFMSLFIYVIDVLGYKMWAHPFLVFGLNPLIIFVFAGVWGRAIYFIRWTNHAGEFVTLKDWLYQNAFESIGLQPINTSLLYSLVNIVFFWFIVWVMYKKKIFIKV